MIAGWVRRAGTMVAVRKDTWGHTRAAILANQSGAYWWIVWGPGRLPKEHARSKVAVEDFAEAMRQADKAVAQMSGEDD